MAKNPYTALIGKETNIGLGNIYGNEPSSKKKKIPPHLKPQLRRIYWNDQNTGECFCCGKQIHFDDAQTGHIKAESRKGSLDLNNLRLICRICNQGMGNKDMRTYMKKHFYNRYKEKFPEEVLKQEKAKAERPKKKRKAREINPLAQFQKNLNKSLSWG